MLGYDTVYKLIVVDVGKSVYHHINSPVFDIIDFSFAPQIFGVHQDASTEFTACRIADLYQIEVRMEAGNRRFRGRCRASCRQDVQTAEVHIDG